MIADSIRVSHIVEFRHVPLMFRMRNAGSVVLSAIGFHRLFIDSGLDSGSSRQSAPPARAAAKCPPGGAPRQRAAGAGRPDSTDRGSLAQRLECGNHGYFCRLVDVKHLQIGKIGMEVKKLTFGIDGRTGSSVVSFLPVGLSCENSVFPVDDEMNTL